MTHEEWDYRIVEYEDGTLGIHEVFYEQGELARIDPNPLELAGYANLTDLVNEVSELHYSLKQPVIGYNELEE